jgi:hypothetical protein
MSLFESAGRKFSSGDCKGATVFSRVQREPGLAPRWSKPPCPLTPDIQTLTVHGLRFSIVKYCCLCRREPEQRHASDVYFGRDKAILKQRERIKRKTLEMRRLHYRQRVA